ncbi:MAG: hypothetical protein LUC31_01020, partial [Coprobacillus sp.]|nr:hypothetical protein [Coprobacillus sp.]
MSKKENYQTYINKLDKDITTKSHLFYIVAFVFSLLAFLCFLLPGQVSDTATNIYRSGSFNWTLMQEIADNKGFNFLPYGGYFLFFVVTIFSLYLMVKSLKDKDKEEVSKRYPISTLYITVLGIVGIGFLATLGSIYTKTMNNGTYSLGVFSVSAIIFMAIAIILVITPYSIKVCTYIGREKIEVVEEKPSLKSRCSTFISSHYKFLVSLIILIVVCSTLTIFGYQGRIYSNGGMGNTYYEVMYIGPAIFTVCTLVGLAFLVNALTFNDKVGANTRLMRYVGFYILVVFGIAVGLAM